MAMVNQAVRITIIRSSSLGRSCSIEVLEVARRSAPRKWTHHESLEVRIGSVLLMVMPCRPVSTAASAEVAPPRRNSASPRICHLAQSGQLQDWTQPLVMLISNLSIETLSREVSRIYNLSRMLFNGVRNPLLMDSNHLSMVHKHQT